MRGLRILGILVEAERPMSATEIAKRCDLHQSSVSRILATLSDGGYVRKDTYRSFVPDYGILALAATAGSQFAIMDRPRQVMQAYAERCPGLTASLTMLWRNQLLYFLRSTAGQRPVLFEGDGYPLHISTPALRIIAEMADAEAEALLAESRDRYGWPIPDPHLPANEQEAVAFARSSVQHDCLIDDGWTTENYVAAAILLKPYEGHPLALALHGPRDTADNDTLRLLLHEMRRDVEAVLGESG